MLKWFANRLAETGREMKRDQRGFTLIELLVVVIIIGILAAIAIPTFLGQRDNAEDSRAEGNLRSAATAMQAAYTEDGSYPGDEEDGTLEDSGWPSGADPEVTIEDNGSESYCLETDGADDDAFSISEDDNTPDESACA